MVKTRDVHSSQSHIFGCQEKACLERLLVIGLVEDLSVTGDVTSQALVSNDFYARGSVVSRQSGVVAGLEAARIVLQRVDPVFLWHSVISDGIHVEPGQVLAKVSGSFRGLLAAERLALNFLQRLSGVATSTRQYVDLVNGLPCKIYDTRKTIPGWRILEKYAVRVGGGNNHRMGLYDAILIKDNHLAGWSGGDLRRSLADAVQRARTTGFPGMVVQIEVDTLSQLEEVLEGNPDLVLLDNMTIGQLRDAVCLRNRRQPKVLLEASGGITHETVRLIAQTGVDRISCGAITHSAPVLDIALDFEDTA